MKGKDLRPLMIFRNTWWGNLDAGYVILLSAEHIESLDIPEYLKRGKDESVWKIAFSYKSMGCQILQWYPEEILKCKFLGYLPNMLFLLKETKCKTKPPNKKENSASHISRLSAQRQDKQC